MSLRNVVTEDGAGFTLPQGDAPRSRGRRSGILDRSAAGPRAAPPLPAGGEAVGDSGPPVTLRRTQFLAPGESVTVVDAYHANPVGAHVHEFYEIALICAGRGWHHYGTRTEAVQPGDLLLINPSVPHAFTIADSGPILVRNVLFTEAAMDDSSEEAYLRALFFNGRSDGVSRLSGWAPSTDEVVPRPAIPAVRAIPAADPGTPDWMDACAPAAVAAASEEARAVPAVSADPSPFDLAACMAAEATARRPGYQAALRGYLLVLLAILWRRYEAECGVPPGTDAWQRLAPVVRRMYDSAGVEQSVEDLAALAGWSHDHFARLFRDAMGQTVRAFLRRLRAHRAASLLLTTTASVEVIAAASGYADARGLRRAFRACFGTTPEMYRKRSGV